MLSVINLKGRFAQSTIEYALILGVAVAAVIAMGVYLQRASQANLKMIEEVILPEPIKDSYAKIGED